MPAHTSGPWMEWWVRPDKERGHNFDPTCSIVVDIDGQRIRVADIPDPLTTEEEANARLIAAAPSMLEELQRMYEAARCMADPKHCLYEYREHLPWKDLADKARAILCDVEGER